MDSLYLYYYYLISEGQDIVDSLTEEDLTEARKKRVIRKGKMIKRTFCYPGQKAKGGKCVPMKAKERTTRKQKARRAAMKRKGKMSRILRKRKKSMRKRKRFGLK
tara:strand:+ start:603 stop:917 length:315 start_codon:yes stop_codon:yes gene_type:complete